MRTELVTDALGMAIIRLQPDKKPGDKRTILHPTVERQRLYINDRDIVALLTSWLSDELSEGGSYDGVGAGELGSIETLCEARHNTC
jgi:hypothetical protein